MAINRISQAAVNNIRRKTAYGLPDRPSERGYKAVDVKRAFYSALTDSDNSITAEVNRVVDEINSELAETNGKVNALSETRFIKDATTKAVTHTVEDNVFACYTADDISSVEIVIPDTVDCGFSAGVYIQSGASAPQFSFTNNSGKPLKMIQYCSTITAYIAQPNCGIRLLLDCDDGNTVCLWIVEVL